MTETHASIRQIAMATALTLWTSAVLSAPSLREGFGPIIYDGGVAFRVWAPNADSVHVAGQFNGWSTTSTPLSGEGDGNWSVDVPGASVGQQYKYVIRNGGQLLWKKDPRSTDVQNSGTDANSIIGDLSHNWQSNDYEMPTWNELVLYEMHIGAFNDSPGGLPGTFLSALQRLDHLVELGVNGIQLMPIHEFGGDFSWGYNPAYPYTVESAYGTPRQFMQFIDECHKRGIAVLIDVVHNHYGPTDLDIWQFDGFSSTVFPGGIYFHNSNDIGTDWGDTRPNYSLPEVRSYIIDNTEYFLDTYRIDGIRWDSTSNIRAKNGGEALPGGQQLLREMNDAVDAQWPGKIMIAEEFGVKNDIVRDTNDNFGFGFDSQWDDFLRNVLGDTAATGDDNDRNMFLLRDAILARYSADAFSRVNYVESHDEVGNGGTRLPSRIWFDQPDSWYSRRRSTLAATILMTAPGIPMILMGQEILMDGFWDINDPNTWLMDWTHKDQYPGIFMFYQDLIRLRRNVDDATQGLTGQNIDVFHVNNDAKVIAYRRWENGGVGDDVVIVANFSATEWETYDIGFPAAGTWHVLLNGDNSRYGDDYENLGPTMIDAASEERDGLPARGTVRLAPYNALILSQQKLPEPISPGNLLIIR